MYHVITLFQHIDNLSSLMKWQWSQNTVATETKIKQTFIELRDDIYNSIYNTSKQLNINQKTLNNHATLITISHAETRETQQILTKTEE